ncbi:hypothetical protein MNBD_GAMMA23-920 [hydrothermal vent metagenome]|uniref:Flagellar biosynthesis protein FlgN n=1 Tax=hydrothermal vent metagenome TaxID=652676 RepID=A0A3B0ZV34_9ZZZZ
MTRNITPLLEDIANYLEQLFHALENEYTALSNNDLQAIESIAQEKTILMEQLEDLNKERHTLLEAAGLNLSENGIDDFLNSSTLADNPVLKTLWGNISSLSKQCEKQNNINGIIIENNKRHTENALSILQGKQQTTELYSSKGQSIKMAKNQTLIRA